MNTAKVVCHLVLETLSRLAERGVGLLTLDTAKGGITAEETSR